MLYGFKKTRNFLLWNLNDPSMGDAAIENLYDIDSNHPNEEGYRRLYEEIAALLKKKDIKM